MVEEPSHLSVDAAAVVAQCGQRLQRGREQRAELALAAGGGSDEEEPAELLRAGRRTEELGDRAREKRATQRTLAWTFLRC